MIRPALILAAALAIVAGLLALIDTHRDRPEWGRVPRRTQGETVTDLTPERRAELRRRISFRRQMGYERVAVDFAPLAALLDAADERDRLRTWQERVALAAGIGEEVEGRGVHLEADPDIAAEHMAGLLAVVDAHVECPIHCDRCGETLADVWCDHCHGSGCGPGTASGAYEECEWCAGAGKVHLGCADLCYAALVSERNRLAAAVERVRALIKGDDTRLMIGSDGIVSEVVDIDAILYALDGSDE